MKCLRKMGKAGIVEMRGSADTTGRADTVLTTKRKRGEETDIDRGETRRKMKSEVRDIDQGELGTAKEKATSVAHGGVQTIRIVQMVAKGQNAIIHPTKSLAEERTTANIGVRRNRKTVVKHTIARERTNVYAAIDEHVDDEESIAIDRHLLTAGSYYISAL